MDEATTDRRGLFLNVLKGVSRTSEQSLDEFLIRGSLGTRTASIDELLAAATDVGLTARAEEVRRLVRRSIRLAPGGEEPSRGVAFGGRVPLPRGVDWPHWREEPLTFLARVGRRLFFFDASRFPTGLEAIHRGAGHVITVDSDDLVLTSGPAWPRGQRPGTAMAELVIPRVWSAPVEALELPDAERTAWEVLRERLASMQGTELTDQVPVDIVHRIYGYPDHTDGDMPRICERCAGGNDFVDGHWELEEPAARWELLAQFSADPELGWSWPGRVYFWVNPDGEIWTIQR